MIIQPSYKNVKNMSNAELILEKEAICNELFDKEKEKIRLNESSSCGREDESIIYAWNIERLEVILSEIKRRMQKAKWIFEVEYNFSGNKKLTNLKQLKELYRLMFNTDIPTLAYASVPNKKLVKLLQEAIYVNLKPLTADDLAEAVGDYDLITVKPKSKDH